MHFVIRCDELLSSAKIETWPLAKVVDLKESRTVLIAPIPILVECLFCLFVCSVRSWTMSFRGSTEEGKLKSKKSNCWHPYWLHHMQWTKSNNRRPDKTDRQTDRQKMGSTRHQNPSAYGRRSLVAFFHFFSLCVPSVRQAARRTNSTQRSTQRDKPTSTSSYRPLILVFCASFFPSTFSFGWSVPLSRVNSPFRSSPFFFFWLLPYLSRSALPLSFQSLLNSTHTRTAHPEQPCRVLNQNSVSKC